MQIHEFDILGKKHRKRIGRGGKRGTYSGRGIKGQKARSGGNVDPLFEGGRSSLTERMKKVRGVKAFRPSKITVTLSTLDRLFSDGETVSLEALRKHKVLSNKTLSRKAKIVATGDIKKGLTIASDVFVSEKAHDAIVKAGGTVQEIQEAGV